MPMVSVGIPTYNRPEGLRNTLNRVTNQTYRNLDIIISDNCSFDRQAVAAVIEEFSKNDSRVRFVRQSENIGAIRNFKFLLDQATADYFVWAADDDELDPEYIEACMKALLNKAGAVIGITGIDVVDKMQEPWIAKEYTRYLQKLPARGTFERLRNYILQPEYYGKYRILWGVIKRTVLVEAFNEAFSHLEPGDQPMWSIMPIDFAVLARGDLAVNPRNLYHVQLLPTSDGMREGQLMDKKQIEICRKGFRSFARVLRNQTTLGSTQKMILLSLLKAEELYALARIVPFQVIKSRSPRLARFIKKLWFDVLVRQ